MTERPAPRKIIKVRVKSTPIRYDGKKYFQNDTLEIQDNEFNNELHEFIENASDELLDFIAYPPEFLIPPKLFAVRNKSNISINKDTNTNFAPGEKFYVIEPFLDADYMEIIEEIELPDTYAEYLDMINGIIRPE